MGARPFSPSLLAFALLLAGCDSREAPAAPVKTPGATNSGDQAADLGASPLGSGLVVWESSRTGAWRIFGRGLDGGKARQLSRDEPGRQHCCAHLSPDGRQLVYLSLPDGQEGYPTSGAQGSLRWLSLQSGAERELLPEARTYFEHRAAVWRDDARLIAIDGRGSSVELTLTNGETQDLVAQAGPHGFLLDPTLSFATQGTPTFAPYDPASRRVLERPTLGGCQPYFTDDGRGYWVAGAGGPIRWIDLRSRAVGEILRKGDARLPADRRYLYFPMISRDRRALVWGASDEAHDHRNADYDIFVAPLDPGTLALAGAPRRVTAESATDRFPDLHVERLDVEPDRAAAAPPAPAATDPAKAQADEILVWRGARHGNLVRDPADGQEISTLFERQGRAFWDERFAADLRGGALLADMGTMQRLLHGARATNEICLDMVLTPRGRDGMVLQFGDDRRQNNLALALDGGALVFELLTASSKGARPAPSLRFGTLKPGETRHVAICYRPGLAEAYLDGKKAASSEVWLEGFFDWRELPLLIGRSWTGGRPFDGRLHRLVARNRFADSAEVASWAASAEGLRPRPAVARAKLELLEKSPTPSLAEIAPYREALAVYRYKVVQVVQGELAASEVRVAHLVLADGETLPITGLAAGRSLELELRPFLDQPQLESLFLADRWKAGDAPLYFSETIAP